MRKALLLAGVLLLARFGLAQNVSFNGQVLFTGGLAYPTIRVCTEPASGTPCTPLASIFSDPALMVPLPNPFTGGLTGQYTFYAATSGTYHIQISGNGILPYDLAYVTLGGTGGGGASILLQTNGVTNGLQTILNLVPGTGISLVNTPATGNVIVTNSSPMVFPGGTGIPQIAGGAWGPTYNVSNTIPNNFLSTFISGQNGLNTGAFANISLYALLSGATFSGTVSVPNLTDTGTALFLGIPAPSNPPAGDCLQYFNSTTLQMTWTNSSGTSCGPSGGGGGIGGGGTTGFVPVFASSTTLANSSITDNGTTVSTTERLFVNTANPLGTESWSVPATCSGSGLAWTNTSVACQGVIAYNTAPVAASGIEVGIFAQSQPNGAFSLSGAPFIAGVFGQGYLDATGSPAWVSGVVGSTVITGGTSGTIPVASGVVAVALANSAQTVTLLDGVDAQTQNTLATEPQGATYYARAPSYSAIVTNHYGFLMADQTVGGSNNPNPHGFWELGNAPNQFAATAFTGNVTFNITGASTQCAQLSTVGVISGTGSPCSSLTIQTQGTNNAVQSTLNMQGSTTNAVGLTVQPTYHAGGAEQFEITGGTYTGQSATTLAFASAPTGCGAGSAIEQITTAGNPVTCIPVGGLSGLTQYGQLYANTATTATTVGPGLIGQIAVSDGTSGPPTMQGSGVASRAITIGGTDTILADSSTTLQDRGKIIVPCNGSTLTETVPDAGTAGMGGNFVFAIDVSDSIVSSTPCTASTTVTINNTSSSKFYISNGLTTLSAQTTFTLVTGQWAQISSPDNANWLVRISVPTSLTTNSGGNTVGDLAAWSTATNLVSATEHNVAFPRVCPDTSGSATAQSCSTTGTPALATNDEIIYTTTTTNTGSLTTAVNGGSALTWKKWSAGALVNLAANDIKAGEPLLGLYDGTNLVIPSAGNAGSGGGSSALSSITPATGANTINNTNFQQNWQWKLTTATGLGLAITEPTASTGGTAGVQALLNVTGLTGSTASLATFVQGTVSGTTNYPVVNITTAWSNSAITGPALGINVTNTSSAAGSCALQINGGATGATKELCVSPTGQLQITPGLALGGTANYLYAIGVAADSTTGYIADFDTTGGGGGAEPNTFRAGSDGFSVMQVCTQGLGGGAAGEAVFGSTTTCGNIYTTEFAKNVMMTSTNGHNLLRLSDQATAETGPIIEANATTAAGSGFDLLQFWTGVTGVDTYHTGGTKTFDINGQGEIFAGASAPNPTPGSAGGGIAVEGTAFTGISNDDGWYGNSANHCFDIVNGTSDVGCADAVGNALTFTALKTFNGFLVTGEATKTGAYTGNSTPDSGSLIVMNCSSACAYTFNGSAVNGYTGSVMSVGSTVATVSLNSKNFNGATSIPVLITGQPIYFTADSSGNFWGNAPLVASTNVTFSPASNGLSISATGGGGTPCTTTANSLQYDNAGAFGCTTPFTFASSTITAAAAGILDLHAATGTAALLVPTAAGETATAAGAIDFDTTNKNFHGFVNGADSIFANFASAPTTNVIPKASISSGNTLLTNSTITDNGTIVSTTEGLQLGAANCTTFGSGGGFCAAEGGSPTNVSGTMALYANSTTHEIGVATNGSTSFGTLVRAQPGAIRSTGLVAAVSTATLCAASAGACNTAGTYHVHIALYQSGTPCTTNTTGGVTPTLTWTDGNGTTHSAVGIPMETNSSLVALTGTMQFNQTGSGIATVFGSGDINIDTNGTVIQYALGFAQCSVSGSATYAASLVTTRLQ